MIRKAQASDFKFIYNLYFHPLINPFLLYEMMDKKSFRPIFKDLLKSDILYIFSMNGQDVGMFKLAPLKHRTLHIAYLGGVGIDPKYAGKGLGTQMMQEIIDFGKTLGLLRIELSTATINDKAIHLYEKVGYQKEGVLRKYTHLKSEDRFLDEVLMSYLY
jgi:L-phenylalanine/L-methionine N-acetyltransferase